MKCLVPVLLCWAALTACATGVQADHRVVGRFKAAGGEVVEIGKEGRILFHSGNQTYSVGQGAVSAEKPLTLRVNAPESSPWVGTTIVFSSDQQAIFVKWWSWQRESRSSGRPTDYRKE